MRHFRSDDEKLEDDDFSILGLHSQRNEDYSDFYDHILKKDEERAENKK